MIRLVDVCKSFGSKEILHHINLTIKDGETLAIIGGSGSGKSTLLRLLIGLIRPTAGQIWVDDMEISQISEKELDKVRLHMGMVFQYSALFDSMTVGDNVAFGLREHTSLSEPDIAQIVQDKLHLVGLDDVSGLMPGELSGGMKKRVSLARAIAFEPKIIFYDEPTSGLDRLTAGEISDLIVEIQEKYQASSIIITHDLKCAKTATNNIKLLKDGLFYAQGTFDELSHSDDKEVRDYLT